MINVSDNERTLTPQHDQNVSAYTTQLDNDIQCMSTQDERQLATAHDQTRSSGTHKAGGRTLGRVATHRDRQVPYPVTVGLVVLERLLWLIGTIWPRWPETEPVTVLCRLTATSNHHS